MNSIAILGLVISALWLVALGFYFYVSRQQGNISEEIDELREKLDGSDDSSGQPVQ